LLKEISPEHHGGGNKGADTKCGSRPPQNLSSKRFFVWCGDHYAWGYQLLPKQKAYLWDMEGKRR